MIIANTWMSTTTAIDPTLVVLPHLVEAGRRHIAFVSSMMGYFGIIGYSAYAPSKFALVGLAEVLRHELRPSGVSAAGSLSIRHRYARLRGREQHKTRRDSRPFSQREEYPNPTMLPVSSSTESHAASSIFSQVAPECRGGCKDMPNDWSGRSWIET